MKYLICLILLAFFSCTNQQSTTSVKGNEFDSSGYEVEFINGSDLKYVSKLDAQRNIIEEGYLRNGLQQGSWVTYNEKGWIESVNNYDHGILNGVQLQFNKRGQITERKSFWNGQFTGLFVQFKNGKPLKEIMYNNGNVDGFIKEYNRSGKLIKLAEYKNNELHGKVETYNDEGKLVLKYIYDSGKKVSGGIVE